MKKKICIFIFLVSSILLSNTCYGQPGSGPGGFDDEPVDSPVGGGIGVLLLGAAAFGYWKLRVNQLSINKQKQ